MKPPPRERLTVKQASQKRADAASTDKERRETEKERQAVIARASQAELLCRPTNFDPELGELDNIAVDIHNSYNWSGESSKDYGSQCVTAVVQMKNGLLILAPQRNMAVMEQRALNMPGSQWDFAGRCDIPGMHAEMWALVYLKMRGEQFSNVAGIGVSKPICCHCEEKLKFHGIHFTQSFTSKEPAGKNWQAPEPYFPV